MNNEQNIKRFEELLNKVNRPGIENLIQYCNVSDFYSAPSSTRFHLAVRGGLLQHSLNVYDCLKSLLTDNNDGTFSYMCAGKVIDTIEEESLILISLLHDICKTNYYGSEKRNRKNAQGEWEQYDFYKVDELFPYGHGEKSVLMVSNFIKLDTKEMMAIRWHMGFPDDYEGKRAYGDAVEKFPIVLAAHTADMMASKIMEDIENNKEGY